MRKLAIFLPLLWVSCSAEQDEQRPGLCTLVCEDSVVAGAYGRTSIDTISGDREIGCQVASNDSVDFQSPETAVFVAKQEVRGNEGMFTTVGGLAFEPMVLTGILSIAKTEDSNVTKEGDGVNQTVKPAHYLGIATPKDQWCSDTCGVMSFQYFPVCVPGIENTINMVIHSGALFSDPVVVKVATTNINADDDENSPLTSKSTTDIETSESGKDTVSLDTLLLEDSAASPSFDTGESK